MIKSPNFSIKQVVDLDEVMTIGRQLRNALEVEGIAKRYLSECQLYVVFQSSQIQYMLDIRDKRIVQFKGPKNGPPSDEDLKEVTDSLVQAGIIHQ